MTSPELKGGVQAGQRTRLSTATDSAYVVLFQKPHLLDVCLLEGTLHGVDRSVQDEVGVLLMSTA